MDSPNPEALLEGLNEPQRAAVVHGDGPLLVLAGPGSGKTRVITHRAAYLAMTRTEAHHILAITFTNKAAREMAERLRGLRVGPGMVCSTFHSFCARLLRQYGSRIGVLPGFSIYDEADQKAAMRDTLKQLSLSIENFRPTALLNQISRAKNDMVTPQVFEQSARGWAEESIAAVYAAYEKLLADQQALDFDDLLLRTAVLLGEDPELRAHLQERFRYVLVDEYQDTNHAQYLIARGLSLDHENLCVTGDPDQSIYAWRGANLHNILKFEEDFPEATVVRLEENYRSTPQILSAADAVITNNTQRKLKSVWTQCGEGPPVRVAECEDQQIEAAFIANQIAEHVAEGGRYGDVAVFYRTNALSRTLEEGLRQATIPYQVARGVAFFQRKEIKDLLAYCKLIVNPNDLVALKRVINTPTRGIGDKTVDRLIAYAERTGKPVVEVLRAPDTIPDVKRSVTALRSFRDLMQGAAEVAEGGSVQEVLEYIVRNSGLVAMWGDADTSDALENATELITAAAEFDQRAGGGDFELDLVGEPREDADAESEPGAERLAEWLHQISLVSDVDAIDEEQGAVTLMTLHAAKGLEFDTVFVVGVEDDLLPHERSKDDSMGIEEERRLFFVAMTRAQRSLTITSAKWRATRGVSRRSTRSPFLRELPADQIELLQVGAEGQAESMDEADDSAGLGIDFGDWRAGQFVHSDEYGVGKLLWVQSRSKQTYAGVAFEHHGEKTLVLEYADLQRVEPDEIG